MLFHLIEWWKGHKKYIISNFVYLDFNNTRTPKLIFLVLKSQNLFHNANKGVNKIICVKMYKTMFVIQHLNHFLPSISSFLLFFSFYFMCAIFCLPICLSTSYMSGTHRDTKRADALASGVMDSCPCEFWGLNLDPLGEHPVLLTAEWTISLATLPGVFTACPPLSILSPLSCVQTLDGCRFEIDHRHQICGFFIPTCPWVGAFSCVFLG